MILLVACSGVGEQATSAIAGTSSAPVTMNAESLTTPTAAPLVTTTSESSVDAGDLEGWEQVQITLGSISLLVALADDGPERSRGLMGVGELGDLDGMLFYYPAPSRSGFWMQGTLIPLDIAFFTAEGVLVDAFEMELCEADPCPLYYPEEDFQWALETPAGSLGVLSADVRFAVDNG